MADAVCCEDGVYALVVERGDGLDAQAWVVVSERSLSWML